MSGPYNRGPYGRGPYTSKGGVVEEAPSSDPYFSNVVLLLHGAGANNSTVFTDSSSFARTMTPVAQAKLSTDAAKFGATSMKFDGILDSITTPFTTDLWMGNANFTLEFFAYMLANPANYARLWGASNGDVFSDIDLSINPSGQVQISITTATGSWNTVANTNVVAVPLNAWHHMALVRDGGSIYFYMNGTRITLTTSAGTNTLFNSGLARSIASQQVGADRSFNGFLAEYRITKGIARYVSLAITVPAFPFPNA